MRAIKVEHKYTPSGKEVLVPRMKDVPPEQYAYDHEESFEWNMRDAACWYLESLAYDNESWAAYEVGQGGLLDDDTMVFVPQHAPMFNGIIHGGIA
jgi:hypothetical protein